MNLSNVCNCTHQMSSIGAKLALGMKPNVENDMFETKVELGAMPWRWWCLAAAIRRDDRGRDDHRPFLASEISGSINPGSGGG